MATPESLKLRHQAILDQFEAHEDATGEVQAELLERALPDLLEQIDDVPEASVAAVKDFINDKICAFRFLRRARFSRSGAISLLTTAIHTRLTLPPPSTQPQNPYQARPLFFFHPDLYDRFGRPCAVLNLREVRRSPDGQLDSLKEFVRLAWEEGREKLRRKSEREGKTYVQMVLIVDLEGAGMSNLELEMLPYFMSLLKNHFPGMVGAIFVLNYGWSFSGMWGVAKRVLPRAALERILFPAQQELLQFFDPNHLLIEHGGNVEYKYTPPAPAILRSSFAGANGVYPSPSSSQPSSPRFPFPPASLRSTPLHSRAASEIGDHDEFHSAPQTPAHSLPNTPSVGGPPSALNIRRTQGLSMTSLSASNSTQTSPTKARAWGIPWRRSKESEGGLKRVSSFAELQARLHETEAEIGESDSEAGSSECPTSEGPLAEEELEDEQLEGGEARGGGRSGELSRTTSRVASRNPSRTTSRATSTDTSPTRFPSASEISPYGASNPFYGYPTPSANPDSYVPIPSYHHRRRKRDLARTLSYLAALRFLALHRELKRRLAQLVADVWWVASLQWIYKRRVRPVDPNSAQKRVHWELRPDERGWWTEHWKKTTTWLVLALVLFARMPRLRLRLRMVSEEAAQLAMKALVGRQGGTRAKALQSGARVAGWVGQKLIK